MTGPVLLGIAGAALAAWQWLAVKPAVPPVTLPSHGPGVNHSSPAVSFVEATAALDRVLGYLRDTGRYGADQAAAARTLRAATVEAATPAVSHRVTAERPEART